MDIVLISFFFAFGAIVGSFLNALIYRIPRGINIAFPRSSCPSCKKIIYWYENIPVLSFIFLRGRCSGCHAKISIRYPFIELVTGLVSCALAPWPITTTFLIQYFFLFFILCIFICHFMIDLEFQILPDSLNITLAVILFTYSLSHFSWDHWVFGVFVGGGVPLIVTWIFYKLRGKIGLGGGDIKLYGALGLYLGPFHILQTIFLSCFLGSIIGGLLIIFGKMNKDKPMPFGPAIIITAGFQIFLNTNYQILLQSLGLTTGY